MAKRRDNPSEDAFEAKRARIQAPVLDAPAKAIAHDFVQFLSGCHSQFHAVEQVAQLLNAAGFKRIHEKNLEDFDVKALGKYYFTRNQSTLIAAAVGGRFRSGNGFSVMGAHTDSPVLKVKPISKISKEGYCQVGVETYGGGLWNTWFDRDLSVAGRVIINTVDSKYESRLVRIAKPIVRIPSLAIHLNRGVTENGFQWNAENHLPPILCTAIHAALNAEKKVKEVDKGKPESHHPELLELLAHELKIQVKDIHDFELCLYDTQPPALMGALDEFVVGRGLDNLCMSYVCTRALIDSCTPESLADETQIRVVALFDNEEVGSLSAQGADSALIPEVLQRLNGDSKNYPVAIRKSLLVSADMAHAVHPNYSDKHEQNHRPVMHKGLVIKQNVNLRYATNAVSGFFLTKLAEKYSIPVQKFVTRQDMPCGTTIGSIVAAKAGIRTVDVGIPQLAMHSIREMIGMDDLMTSKALLMHLFQEYSSLDQSFESGD